MSPVRNAAIYKAEFRSDKVRIEKRDADDRLIVFLNGQPVLDVNRAHAMAISASLYDWLHRPLLHQRVDESELIGADRHQVQFTEEGWTVQHPLCERINGSLFDCWMNFAHIEPPELGRFWVNPDGTIGDPV